LFSGAQGRNRTTDTVIFSHVLYQLSYLGADAADRRFIRRRGYKDEVSGCPDGAIEAKALPTVSGPFLQWHKNFDR
jgi:hypothetical protein